MIGGGTKVKPLYRRDKVSSILRPFPSCPCRVDGLQCAMKHRGFPRARGTGQSPYRSENFGVGMDSQSLTLVAVAGIAGIAGCVLDLDAHLADFSPLSGTLGSSLGGRAPQG